MTADLYNLDKMFSANETPWHGLGIVTEGTLDLDTALTITGMDFNVSKVPVYARLERPDESVDAVLRDLLVARSIHPYATFGELLTEINYDIPVEDKFATMRDDVHYPLGVVGRDYTVFQNTEQFDIAREIADDVQVETAGTLKNGRIVWLLCRFGDDFAVGGDAHQPYILFTSSHDGSTKLQVMPTAVRVVCGNTLRMALASSKASWTISHTRSIHGKARQAAETLAAANNYMSDFQREVEKLIDTTVTDLKMEELLSTMVPDPTPDRDGKVSERALNFAIDKRGKIRHIYNRSIHVGPYRGTGWGVVQAFSSYDLWGGRIQGGEGKRLERQALRIIGGDTMTNTSKVRELLLATS